MDLLIVLAFIQAAFLIYLASRLWPSPEARDMRNEAENP